MKRPLGLAQRITPAGEVTTYHFDPQGSTVAISDSGGNITDAYAYDSFGVLANVDGEMQQPFRYLARYGIIDDGTGFYYARARYFSPELSRFLTQDPVSGWKDDGQSLNRFVYALNNPLRFEDPTGESAHEGHFQADLHAAEAAYWDAYYQAASWMVPYLTALKYAGDVAQIALTVVTEGGSAAVEEGLTGTALARQLGQEGEQVAKIVKNTERILSLTGTANYRIPDVLDRANGVIGEVKNVGPLSWTSQLQDFAAYAQENGFRFELTVRPSTQLSGPLQEAIQSGNFILKFLPK